LLLGIGMVSVASAQPAAVGNTSQQGSVLIFPKIDVTGSTDTLISLSNGNSAAVNVECYWVDSTQYPNDFMFTLTPNQPIVFDAKLGLCIDAIDQPAPVTIPPFPTNNSTVGELKCWATDAAGDTQISWNYLTGSAKIIDYSAYTAYEYNAWSFTALTAATGAGVGTPGVIALDGVNYEACPAFFMGNFLSSGSDYGFIKDTELTLVPCVEDLREERTPTYTKALFNIWNENEVQLSGAVQCVKCFFEGSLSGISPQFTYKYIESSAARFRTQGVVNQVCPGTPQIATPFVGLIVENLDFSFGSPKTADSVGYAPIVKTASTGFGSGISSVGVIKWDVGLAPVQAKKSHKK
jgi:hypothetical protein